MIIGIPRESQPGETRVAATPATVGQILKLGYSVVVESGAGAASSFSDAAYVEAGASIGSPWAADVVLKVNAPDDSEIAALKDGATLIGLIKKGDQVIVPKGDTRLAEGDVLTIFAMRDQVAEVERLFQVGLDFF